MSEQTQCDNCGALLTKEDLFCGECGAPRADGGTPVGAPPPANVLAAQPSAAEPAAAPTKPEAAAEPTRFGLAPQHLRTISIILVTLALVVAIGLCLGGLFVAFLVPDSDTGLTATSDMLIASGVCCFCPGALALIVAAVVWVLALRRK